MKTYIARINKNIKVEEAKRAIICECQEIIDRLGRDIEWSKSRLLNEDGTENEYYKSELENDTERKNIYEELFKTICDYITEL